MAPLPRKNSIMDKIDAGIVPSGTTKRSPAMANAPAVVPKPKMPLGSAAAQKAYAPPAPGIDNRLNPVGAAVSAPFTVAGAADGMVNATRERNYGFRQRQMDAFGTDMSKPRTFLPSTNATMDQISREGEAYSQQLQGPVMPPNLSPQGQEAWAANQRMQRNAANQGAVANSITGGGTRAMGPNGMPLRSSAGYLPNTVQPSLGAGGRTVLRPDGSPMVERVPSQQQQQPQQPVMDDAQMRERFTNPQMTDSEQAAAAAAQGRYNTSLGMSMMNRAGAQRAQEGPQSNVTMPDANKLLAERQRRMDAQRADSSNKKWEDARQERIASHKTKRDLISARGIQDADARRARLNARKGYLAETAFQGMDPEQQLTYMTGGRSRSQMGDTSAAREDLYRAQADGLRTQNDLNQALIDEKKKGSGAADGAAGATAPDPYDSSPLARIGVPKGEPNVVDGLRSSGVSLRDPKTRRSLQEWADSPEEVGTWSDDMYDSEVESNNALRRAIRSGNWDEAQRLIDGGKAAASAIPLPSPASGDDKVEYDILGNPITKPKGKPVKYDILGNPIP